MLRKQLLCAIAPIFLLDITLPAQTPTIPTPQQTDQVIQDNNSNSKADPGDKIRYKVTVQNTGTGNATGTQLNAVPDSRTTLDGASFRSSPVAVSDGPYACTGNVGISVPAASGVKTNDFDDNLAGATLSVVTAPTNGSVALNNDGSFIYTPNAGYTGSDQFTYEITDVTPVSGHTPASGDIRGTVSITVSNLIWFIDNSSVAATSDGRRNTPFKTLAGFNAGSAAAGDVIYIEHTGTDYTGGIVLANNERLFGEGHTGGANLSNVLPFTLATHSIALPAINGSRPIITNANVVADGVTLAQDNTLRGFDVGACSSFAIDNTMGTSVGNLVVSEVSINNTAGGGFQARNGSGASMSAVFSSISSSGGTNGINLVNCAGTFTCNGGTILNPTGTGVQIYGGSVAFSTSGAIMDDTDFAVDVDNHDSGNATFSGGITTSGTGIRVQNCSGGTKTFSGGITTTAGTAITVSNNNGGTINFSGSSKSLSTGASNAVALSSNTGATINFTGGGLVITTTSGTGFNATGGGTVTVQGTGNTINSTSGATALNVVSTTIGASNLNFQSISSNGGTAAGIILHTTGTIGGLVVTGDGTNTTQGGNASGGTIANKNDGGTNDSGLVGTAIYLNNTSYVVLRRMQINDCQNFGIRGLDVGNVTFQYSIINGNNGNTSVGTEDCIGFGTSQPAGANGLKNSAVALIDNCIIRGAVEHNVEFYNIANTFNVTISNCNITNNSLAAGGDGIQIELHTDSNAGTAAANGTFSIQNCFFDDNKSQPVQAAANGDSFIDITINNCIVQKTTQGNEGFILSNGTDGDLVAHVTNNMITGIGGAAIFVGQTPGNATANSSLTAVITGNTIVHPTSATNSAIIAWLTSCDGNFCSLQASTANILIDNNMVTQNSTMGVSRGIFVDTPDNNTTPSYTVTVTNNTVHVGDGVSGVNGIALQCRRGSGCFDVRGNKVDFPNGNTGNITGLRVRQVAPGAINLERGAAALVDPPLTVLNTNNTATTNEVLGTVTVVDNNACLTPPN